MNENLVDEILSLIDDAPDEWVNTLATRLETSSPGMDWHNLRDQLLETAPQTGLHKRLSVFLENWKSDSTTLSPAMLALVLRTAASATARQRARQRVELAWTGPRSVHIPLRRTDQALLQLIQSAKEQLLIVSFAVYKAQNILQALESAAGCGVNIVICVESADASEGKVAYDTLAALGEALRARSRVYIWPLEERPTTYDGKHGSLHAKVAVADSQSAFISSANLTDYAMNLNMELGVLIEGGPLPGQIRRHFEALTIKGILSAV